MEVPLNNRTWLTAQFADIRSCNNEVERLHRIERIVEWENPGPGGVYVNLGAHGDRRYFPDSVEYGEDAAGLYSPKSGFSSPALLRKNVPQPPKAMKTSWMTQRETLLDRPLRMEFTSLLPESDYRLRVVYGGETENVLIRLVAGNAIEIHDFMEKPFPYRPLEFAVPREATASGTLRLTWTRDNASPGAGRGCQVSEIWILPTEGDYDEQK